MAAGPADFCSTTNRWERPWFQLGRNRPVLSAAELIAIGGFLFERSARPACVGLVAIFAVAALLTALQGQAPLRFLYFAATAVYIAQARRAPAPEGATAPLPAD
jgi:hypothetical protein